MTTALIFGATGQDGQLLADKLIRNGYSVIGIARTVSNLQKNPLNLLRPKVILGNILDGDYVLGVINVFKPEIIYNLSGQSSVAKSYLDPVNTIHVNSLGILNVLEAIRKINQGNRTRVFQASSSEMFGSSNFPLSEQSNFHPISPYAISKYLAHRICVEYREKNNVFVSTGIMFNHESELHGENFVFQKVIRSLVRIKQGKENNLKLGNLNIERDWGYAGDYVDAMVKVMEHNDSSDYVIATGKSYTLKNLIEEVTKILGINKTIEELVKIDRKLLRPNDIAKSVGNPTKIKNEVSWESSIEFTELVSKIIEFNLRE